MSEETRTLRVGLLALLALLVLGAGIFFIGEQSSLFHPKNHYLVRFPSAEGLQEGNPVQISGVRVGTVKEVLLPEDASDPRLEVRFSVESRYAQRVRENSEAAIKTIGLLGDKFIEVSPGSAEEPPVADGGEIQAAQTPGVEELMASGEDIAGHIVSISRSLSDMLVDIQQGKGVIGDLMTSRRAGDRSATEAIFKVADTAQALLDRVEAGEGTLGKVIADPQIADNLTRTTARLDRVLALMEEGDGLLPQLLNDPELRDDFGQTLANLEASSARLDAAVANLTDGEGLLPKLMTDEEYGAKVSAELEELLERLNLAAEEITEGDGTVAQLIRDPHVYEALNDIVVGINDAKLLRWLIRNRQRAGAKDRLEDDPEAEAPYPEEP